MYDKFHAYLCELDSGFAKLAELLHQKLDALERFDIAKLDTIIKEEQVYVLLSKGFDNNIKSHRDKLSLSGEKLSDIIEELPEAEKQRFKDVFVRLKSSLDEVKTLNTKCQGLIEERLYTLDKAIKELDASAGATYGKAGSAGKPPGDTTRLFTKSV